MNYCTLYHFFDNSTVSGLIAVFVAALLAKWVYKHQKEIDRRYNAKEKLIEALFLIEVQCKEFNLYIDRSINTIDQLKPDESEDFYNKVFPKECDRMSDNLMNELPKIVGKAESILAIYFDNKTDIQRFFNEIIEEYIEWRTWAADTSNLVNVLINKKHSSETGLSLEKLHTKIISLGDSLKEY